MRYHCILNGIKIENIDKCSIDGISNAIIENNFSDEIVCDIESWISSIHNAVCENFSWDFIDKILI